MAHKKNIQKYEQEHSADVYYSTVIQLPEAEVLLRRSDIEKAVWEVVATLPEKCREVFTLSKDRWIKKQGNCREINYFRENRKTSYLHRFESIAGKVGLFVANYFIFFNFLLGLKLFSTVFKI